MDAGFDRRAMSLRAIGRGKLVAAADRAMHDMHRTAGAGAEFIDLGGRERLRDRRPRQSMRGVVGDAPAPRPPP